MRILLSLLCVISSTFSYAQVKPKEIPHQALSGLPIEKIDSLFDEANDTYRYRDMDVFVKELSGKLNGSILISHKDSVFLRKNFGYIRLYGHKKGYENWSSKTMDTERRKESNKINSSTFFELASLSKQFTAAAVLKLVETRKLKLTDTLRKFFPELPYNKITIQQLLSHTSGLPEYFDFPFDYWKDTSKMLTNRDVIDLLAEKKPNVLASPGVRYKYCNTGYMLLASIVEKASGMKFEEYVRRYIFLPAGMKKSFYVTQLSSKSGYRIAKGHKKNKEELPMFFMDGTVGDKGVYSTPAEILSWGKAYFNNKILKKEWVEKATSKQNFLKGKAVAKELYGYGLRLEEDPKYGKLIYHGGLWRGFQNIMLYREKGEVFIIILSNHYNNAHLRKSTQILHILDGA